MPPRNRYNQFSAIQIWCQCGWCNPQLTSHHFFHYVQYHHEWLSFSLSDFCKWHQQHLLDLIVLLTNGVSQLDRLRSAWVDLFDFNLSWRHNQQLYHHLKILDQFSSFSYQWCRKLILKNLVDKYCTSTYNKKAMGTYTNVETNTNIICKSIYLFPFHLDLIHDYWITSILPGMKVLKFRLHLSPCIDDYMWWSPKISH